jgi:hypothetical protein
MTGEEFVEIVRKVVYQSAVEGTIAQIQRPFGRTPPAQLVELSEWTAKLSNSDKEMLRRAVAFAAHQATFGMLAVLDGVRQVEAESDKGTLRLTYEKNGKRDLLNNPQATPLHDLLPAWFQ